MKMKLSDLVAGRIQQYLPLYTGNRKSRDRVLEAGSVCRGSRFVQFSGSRIGLIQPFVKAVCQVTAILASG